MRLFALQPLYLLNFQGPVVGFIDAISWLHSLRLQVEKPVGLLLQGGGLGIFDEVACSFNFWPTGGSGEGGEVFQQAAKALDGVNSVAGSFTPFFFLGCLAALGGGDGTGALVLGTSGVFFPKEKGGESVFHFPLDVVGEHAEEDVGFDHGTFVVKDGSY